MGIVVLAHSNIIAYKLPDGRYGTARLAPGPDRINDDEAHVTIQHPTAKGNMQVGTEEWFYIKLTMPQPFPISAAQAEKVKFNKSGGHDQEKFARERPTKYAAPPKVPAAPPKFVPIDEEKEKDEQGNTHINLGKLRLPVAIVKGYAKLATHAGDHELPRSAMQFFLRTLWSYVNNQNFDNQLLKCDFTYLREGKVQTLRKRAHWSPRDREIAVSPHLFNAKFEVFINTFVHEMCVSGDALIPTDKGLVRMDQLVPKGASKVLTRDGTAIIQKAWCSGKKLTYKIVTQRGKELRLTGNHPVLVLTPNLKFAWRRVDRLQPNDVLINRLGGQSKSQMNLDFAREEAEATWSGRTKKKTLQFPSTVTPELARLLGHLVAEGSFVEGSSTITFSNTDTDLLSDYENCWIDCFGFIPLGRTQEYDGKTITDIITTRADIAAWFSAIGFYQAKSPERTIPFIILEAPREAKIEFLKSFVEGDGSLSCNRLEIKLSSPVLIQQLQLLLEQLEVNSIVSSVKGKLTKGSFKENTYYVLRCNDAATAMNAIGTISKNRSALSKSLQQRHATKKNYIEGKQTRIPYAASFIKDAGFVLPRGAGRFPTNKGGECNRSLVEGAIQHNPGNSSVPMLDRLLNDRIVYDRIASVEEHAIEPVYDMTTSAGEFVANGLVVHNCHQAVTDIDHADKSEWPHNKGHGPIWKSWMVKCGLKPYAYDDTPNDVYKKKEDRDKANAEHTRAVNILHDSGQIASKTPVPFGDIKPGNLYMRLNYQGTYWLVRTTRMENTLGGKRLSFTLVNGIDRTKVYTDKPETSIYYPVHQDYQPR